VMGSAAARSRFPQDPGGLLEAASGRRLVYASDLNNVPHQPTPCLSSFETADRDLAAIAAAVSRRPFLMGGPCW